MSYASALAGAMAVTVGVAFGAAPWSVANAAAPAGLIQFAPHRAVYEITLERSASGSGVVELTGRMVYELNGSRCEGYTQNMRFVTRIISQEGTEQLSDLRTSSWEDGEGKRLRFNTEQYRDSKLVESTAGDARRQAGQGPITVNVIRPAKQRVDVDATNLFPMQHSTALLKAAEKGQRQLVAGIYDGSEKGEKVYETSAWIGAPITPAKTVGLPAGLEKLRSWPVSIAYFDPGSESKDALPAYELSFDIFENGVSTNMMIDYGDFAIRGQLKELTFYARSDCSRAAVSKDGAPSMHRGRTKR
ncbi:MAG TPA: cell envelope integrity EipB family protein [Hyphomicrobiaceae bacterium]|nr:cell envelope integrity EipB family protein [Hyphomicrobiaceae bacterium]